MHQQNKVKLDQFIREDRFELESYVSQLIKHHSNDAPTRSHDNVMAR
ncbi:hypothetical protein SAMN05216244_2952 [Sediminibacillus halophilus]|uniref:Uncharacterized protein n=1 Tax=Sediminibacillus halophilus TaxID=482461 RepID=A0A1G9UBW5_9BACI|nr:hypothetical protein SAMN05216244_2952 [Sediminibacillus halophilus]